MFVLMRHANITTSKSFYFQAMCLISVVDVFQLRSSRSSQHKKPLLAMIKYRLYRPFGWTYNENSDLAPKPWSFIHRGFGAQWV